jgi:hypothetical protein
MYVLVLAGSSGANSRFEKGSDIMVTGDGKIRIGSAKSVWVMP